MISVGRVRKGVRGEREGSTGEEKKVNQHLFHDTVDVEKLKTGNWKVSHVPYKL